MIKEYIILILLGMLIGGIGSQISDSFIAGWMLATIYCAAAFYLCSPKNDKK